MSTQIHHDTSLALFGYILKVFNIYRGWGIRPPDIEVSCEYLEKRFPREKKNIYIYIYIYIYRPPRWSRGQHA